MTPGKPHRRGLARRQAMLDAAKELFLEKGFERTSLSEILERSKGSRTTLYALFGNKEGLLRAIVAAETAKVWDLFIDDPGPCSFCEKGLVALGKAFVRAALSPNAMAVFRILVAEGHRAPDIAEFFFDTGPRALKNRLAERFQAALPGPDSANRAEACARIYLGAVMGDLYVRMALGLESQLPTEEQIDAHVYAAVTVFLDGVGRPAVP